MSELAKQLIEKEKQERTGKLDLGRCGLTDLNDIPELFELEWLEELILSNQWWDEKKRKWVESQNKGGKNLLSALPPTLSNLTHLESLKIGGDYVSRWQISDILVLEKLTSLTSLNLSSNQITDSRFLEKLASLNSLDLSYNQISDIRFVEKLTSLTSLDLSSNQISDIRFLENLTSLTSLDLSYNQISDIRFVEKLTELTTLDLRDNQISDIRFLERLTTLTTLDLRDNQISDIRFLEKLTALKTLYLHSNQISDIRFLERLTALNALDLSLNQISDVRPLLKLDKLRKIVLNHNQITDLSGIWEFLIKKRLKAVWEEWNDTEQGEINLKDNPITTPPLEVVKEGHEAILNYFQQLEREGGRKDYLYEAKLLIIGEAGSGKTTFAWRIKNQDAEMPGEGDSTHGINIDKWEFTLTAGTIGKNIPHRNTAFYVNLWDFGGQEIYHGTHQFFFSHKSLYVLLADTREQKTDFSYWLNTVEQLSGEDSSLFILLNKPEDHNWKIDKNGLESRFGSMLKETVTIDLSVCEDLPPLQERIQHWMKQLPDIRQEMIESWVRIRESLAKETANFVNFDRFREICRTHGQTEKQDILFISSYFNRIGVFTHYMDNSALQDRIYLNSNWLVKTVYLLLEDQTIAKLNGRLTKKQVEEVWSDNELHYEVDKLTALLEHFGLMYKSGKKDEYIVPEHLPALQPYVSWAHEHEKDLLHFRYQFDKYMPKGLMSRLIVALHRYVTDQELVWNRGVNISHQGAHAEILEQYGGVNQFDIRIAGHFQRDLLVLITTAFDNILGDFAKLNFSKSIKCPCRKCSEEDKVYFHNTKDIENALIAKAHKPDPSVECKNSFEDVLLSKLLAVIDYEKVMKNIQEKSHGNQRVMEKMEELLGITLGHRRETREGFSSVSNQLDDIQKSLQDTKSIIAANQTNILQALENNQTDDAILQGYLTDIMEKLNQVAEKQESFASHPAFQEVKNALKTDVDVKGKFKLTWTLLPSILTGIPNIAYEKEISLDLKAWTQKVIGYFDVFGSRTV
ncbi:MAG: COR domain-containing protein [Saprospiraceae bacterium]